MRGIPIRLASQVEFKRFALEPFSSDSHTLLYAIVTNPESDEATTAFFDVTAYAEDGSIIDRAPTSVYLLPGQTSMLDAIFSVDISATASFAIEQTSLDVGAPVFTGGASVDDIAGGDGGYVEATFTSSLNAVAEYTDVYIVGFIDGEIYAVCTDFVDVPVNAAFTADCFLDPAWDETEHDVEVFSDEAEFDAYVGYDIPF